MDPTVTNGGGMTHASTLAEKAAGAIGDGEVAAADLSWASMALSLAEMAKSTRILAEQAGPELALAPVAVLSADSPVGTVAVVGKANRYVRVCDIPGVDDCWRRTTDPITSDDLVSFDWLASNDARLLSAGPVPLASADLLSDEAMNDVFRQINHGLTSSPKGRDTYRRIADAVNAKLREQFPDETPLPEPAAPFVRGVAELSDDELDSIYRRANDFTPHYELSVEERAFTQAIVAGVAARLRVDGPDGEQPLAEMTAHALNAAKVGSTVMDSESEQWTKTGPERWRCDCGAHIECLSGPLVDSFGPLRELRSPAEITAEMLDAAEVGWTVADKDGDDWKKKPDALWQYDRGASISARRLSEIGSPLSNLRPPSQPVPTIPFMTDAEEAESRAFWNDADAIQADRDAVKAWGSDEVYGTRDRLIALALHAAGGYYQRDGLPAQVSAAADLDAAAREHVTALLGPATGDVIEAPGPVVTPGAPSVSDEDVSAALDAWLVADGLQQDHLRAALECYAARLASRATGGYEPAKLTVGSAIVAQGQIWVCSRENDSHRPYGRWDRTPHGGSWMLDGQVPLDGVLVFDGAQLGGTR